MSVEQAVLIAFMGAAAMGLWTAWMVSPGDEWKITVLVRAWWGWICIQFHRTSRAEGEALFNRISRLKKGKSKHKLKSKEEDE